MGSILLEKHNYWQYLWATFVILKGSSFWAKETLLPLTIPPDTQPAAQSLLHTHGHGIPGGTACQGFTSRP